MNATHTNQSPLETPGIRTNAATALERGAHDILNYTQYAMVFFFGDLERRLDNLHRMCLIDIRYRICANNIFHFM